MLHECCTILQDLRVKSVSKVKRDVDVDESYKLEPISHGGADVIIKIS